MNETTLLHRLMLATTKIGARVFRNHVGQGWHGKTATPCNRTGTRFDVIIAHARRLTAGLCEGSSDLIGWYSLTITPDMVGRRVGVFVAIEAKTATGRLTEEQQRFLDAVREAGGIAIEARDVDAAVDALRQAW